jgi:hypothetical protein
MPRCHETWQYHSRASRDTVFGIIKITLVEAELWKNTTQGALKAHCSGNRLTLKYRAAPLFCAREVSKSHVIFRLPIQRSKVSSAHKVMKCRSSVGQRLVLQPISSSFGWCTGGAIDCDLVGVQCADINVSVFGSFEKITRESTYTQKCYKLKIEWSIFGH